VESSNHTDSYSIIPKLAKAKISVRTVPDQKPEKLVELIRAHVKHEFGKRRSPNDLFIEVRGAGGERDTCFSHVSMVTRS
jgi:acetylornithine deacetylase/succinyl-diaminopimelate desuccinylase-like protein